MPIPQPLKKSLVEWFKINPYDIAVCDKNGKHIDPDIMSSYLRGVGDRLGIYFHFHMLRHTCSTNLYNSGMDPKKVQTFMRHSSMNTTMMVYTHVDQNDLKDAINNVFR
ncbi:MAG: site-specific integrase [Erysipelotrichaceae bacterium]|nr:site-specific integrase [Erysipelotrichaceae bacterium]